MLEEVKKVEVAIQAADPPDIARIYPPVPVVMEAKGRNPLMFARVVVATQAGTALAL